MISVLVPYAPAGDDRQRTWDWNAERWRQTMPDAELIIAAPSVVYGDPGRFNRPEAINRAAAQATSDVFVIADSDTAFDADQVRQAAKLVWEASAAWVLPGRYVRLSQPFSALWTSQPSSSPIPDGWEAEIDEEWPANVSGIVVVSREGFEAVGGFDERFKGWGWDDGSFACAMNTLWGTEHRLEGHIAWHLWHPRPNEHSIHGPYAESQQRLGARYLQAAGKRSEMLALIDEGKGVRR